MSIWCPLGRKLSTPYAVLCQPIRTRYVADPGTLEQRLFRAVTQPVIPPLGITPTERRIRNQEQRRIREENNPYRKFLVEKARSDFFREADDRMVLVIQPLHHKWREFVPIRNQLFLKNMVFHGFPVPILREAAIGTRWENFTEHFLQTSSHNFYLFGDADPLVCRNALSILKTAPFLLLLGPELRADDAVRHASARHMAPTSSGISKSVFKPRHQVYLAAFNVRTLKQAGQQAVRSLILDSLDALETLAKHSRVQLQLCTLHPDIRAQFFPKSKEDAIVLSSDILRKIVRDTDSVIVLVDGAKDVPIFSLTPKSSDDESHNNLFHKLGIKLAKGERAKTLRLRVNIDDHMLSIRIKQAESFIRSGYVVVVLIKLPKHRIVTNPSDEEGKRLNKLAYDVDTQRFVTAFSAVPDASMHLMERSKSTEILFLLRPCESK
ncbi:hypothetical protein T265_12588 [Opisthorchis viverrini]|uniref:Uncharacterized protein n=1 Tax=Opisthorchis viverrini TaxID=6198 RepID=A0A075A2B4_OPIVI|nr:hypothetical protein T265_12588 [Opisthorchis viverrini]KER33511.1 hypothetical protein T265_12588 [Opisthorchis viverrini]